MQTLITPLYSALLALLYLLLSYRTVRLRRKLRVAIGDGHKLGATGHAEIDAKVDALAAYIGGVTLVEGTDGVAVRLTQKPAVWAWWLLER